MSLQILSLHTGYIKDTKEKLIDVKSVFFQNQFPSLPDFSVGVAVLFTIETSKFTLRIDILNSNREQLHEGLHEVDPLIRTYYKNQDNLVMEVWLMPDGHIIPEPGSYIVNAKLLAEDDSLIHEKDLTVIISPEWEEFNPWVM